MSDLEKTSVPHDSVAAKAASKDTGTSSSSLVVDFKKTKGRLFGRTVLNFMKVCGDRMGNTYKRKKGARLVNAVRGLLKSKFTAYEDEWRQASRMTLDEDIAAAALSQLAGLQFPFEITPSRHEEGYLFMLSRMVFPDTRFSKVYIRARVKHVMISECDPPGEEKEQPARRFLRVTCTYARTDIHTLIVSPDGVGTVGGLSRNLFNRMAEVDFKNIVKSQIIPAEDFKGPADWTNHLVSFYPSVAGRDDWEL